MNNSRDCVFCKIVSGEVKTEFLKESENFIAIKDVNPISKGHTLILPKEHYATLMDIPDGLGKEMIQFMKSVASDVLERNLGEGFNVIINNFPSAGQFVMHAHVHIIPRKDGDGIRFLVKE
ncbi:MAG TPA: HIT domain-containing protein [Candidatus Nanoarchaeia archaeon]|nr:HIT domain-containing protein [Candidatus Nanoarchaeia archaeon]